jgi:hypothetical protein
MSSPFIYDLRSSSCQLASTSRFFHFISIPSLPNVLTAQNVRAGLADAQRVLSSSAPEAEKAEAEIEVSVFEGLQAALGK